MNHAFRGPLLLAVIVLALRLVTALPLERAGYMDASYTQHVAANIAGGRGLVEDILWNYLDRPRALPHPSNLYWLPLPSILAGGSMAVFGSTFRAAQLPFVLLSVAPPLFAFLLARRLYRREDYAWTAGLLTAFSGFYTVYWVSPDNFTPFAVTADLALFTMALGTLRRDWRWFFAAGLCTGVSQLARADAALLLMVAPVLIWLSLRTRRPETAFGWAASSSWFALTAVAAMGAGFVILVLPWFVRNLVEVGGVLAPGAGRVFWLRNYEELFRWNVEDLTPQRYFASGLSAIVGSKLTALWLGFVILLFGVFQIYLFPFAVIGGWMMRRSVEIQAALIYALLLVLTMALVFTFPATHGSLLHSAAALVPFGAVLVPPGLDAAVRWAAQRRKGWNVEQAQRFFRVGCVALAVVVSIYLYAQGVFALPNQGATVALWNERDIEYVVIDAKLDELRVPGEEPVLTVDPPSFINLTGRRSIYIPTDGIEAVFSAAAEFGARYLVLQYDHPSALSELYRGTGAVAAMKAILKVQDALGRPVVLFQLEY